jgi:death-on-curing protein
VPEPVFLEFSVIEDLHEDSLSRYGGSPGLRDRHLVESALAAAINTYYYAAGDLFDIAATYAFHLAQAQAFLDGNKRTAAGAALVFLRANGVAKLPLGDVIYDALIAIAEKRLDKAGMAQVFRRAALSAS